MQEGDAHSGMHKGDEHGGMHTGDACRGCTWGMHTGNAQVDAHRACTQSMHTVGCTSGMHEGGYTPARPHYSSAQHHHRLAPADASQAPGQPRMCSFIVQKIHIHLLIPKVAAERDCCEVLGMPILSCIIVLPVRKRMATDSSSGWVSVYFSCRLTQSFSLPAINMLEYSDLVSQHYSYRQNYFLLCGSSVTVGLGAARP